MSAFILEHPAPPREQASFPILAPLPALDIDQVLVAAEKWLNRLVGGLLAFEIEGGFLANHIVAEEGQAGLIRPSVDLVFVYLHDHVRYGGQDGFLASGEGPPRLFVPPALAPSGCLAQLPLHGGNQASRPVFHDVIVGAGLHGRHGLFLADRAGNNEERQVLAARLEQLQRGRPAEVGQLVIGQHNVPPLSVERGAHRLGRLDALPHHVVAAFAQLAHHQPRVVFRVLDDQAAEGSRHDAPWARPATDDLAPGKGANNRLPFLPAMAPLSAHGSSVSTFGRPRSVGRRPVAGAVAQSSSVRRPPGYCQSTG